MERDTPSAARAWSWIPTLYYTEGLPYAVAMTLSVAMYKSLGVSNAQIAFYTSWLYVPWVIKPLWSPLVELLGRKRLWIVATQLVMGALFAAVALTVPGSAFFQTTLALFWLLAFSSATHDIAADGFYLLALPEHQRAAFVGVRSTFYKVAMLAAQGGLVFEVGHWIKDGTGPAQAWSWAFAGLAGFFGLVALYHHFALPRPSSDVPAKRGADLVRDSLEVFAAFFRKPGIGTALAFMLLYRFGEAQLVKMIQPFLLDARDKGGLGLALDKVGFYYGTIGTAALLVGGLLGGWVVSRWGLKRLLWPMVCAIHVPNLAYVYLALARPDSLAAVGGAIAVEQFGYGFGFTAYMLYLMLFAEGENKTAHYAICTGFMALGMMVPGLWSGWLQEHLGYVHFFGWVCLATIPSFAVTALIEVADHYGKRQAE
jgi:PAT family beta-lactamase induction signal transducer AmpG